MASRGSSEGSRTSLVGHSSCGGYYSSCGGTQVWQDFHHFIVGIEAKELWRKEAYHQKMDV